MQQRHVTPNSTFKMHIFTQKTPKKHQHCLHHWMTEVFQVWTSSIWSCSVCLYLRVIPPHIINHLEDVQFALVTFCQVLQDLMEPGGIRGRWGQKVWIHSIQNLIVCNANVWIEKGGSIFSLLLQLKINPLIWVLICWNPMRQLEIKIIDLRIIKS